MTRSKNRTHPPLSRPKKASREFAKWRENIIVEFVAWVMLFHAGCAGIFWGIFSSLHAFGLWYSAGAVWLIVRCAGAFNRTWVAVVVTCLLIAVYGVNRGELPPDCCVPALHYVFNNDEFMGMMSMVLVFDVLDSIGSHSP